jgi:hypothetical protein
VCGEQEFCDNIHDACYPVNGRCQSDKDCPQFRYPEGVLDVFCGEDGYCTVKRGSSTPEWLTNLANKSIAVISPRPGDTLAADDVAFSWEEPNAPMLIYVLDRIPSSVPEFNTATLWATSIPVNGGTVASWNSGCTVKDGEWLPASPPPTGTYYFFGVAVELSHVLAVSDLVPFAIGTASPWPRVDDSCEITGVPGGCDRPDIPQACVREACRRVCASHSDCESPQRCREPEQVSDDALVRVCALPKESTDSGTSPQE